VVDRFDFPALASVRLTSVLLRTVDVLERLAVHSRYSAIGLAAFVSESHNILAVRLVVQCVEAKVRRYLIFACNAVCNF
jgi:hypothetical protein